jgi:hypothetical protein
VFNQTGKLVKRSICRCGFPLVNEDVELGKLYQVDMTIITEWKMECGGCHRLIPVRCAAVVSIGQPAGLLPLEALEIISETPQEKTH